MICHIVQAQYKHPHKDMSNALAQKESLNPISGGICLNRTARDPILTLDPDPGGAGTG